MIVFAIVSPAHFKSQVELEQLTEQLPVQVTWQVDDASHDTLPLLPTVTLHVEPLQLMLPLSPVVRVQLLLALHSPLHEPEQLPVQVLAPVQASEQLEPELLQPVAVLPAQLQLPELQTHDEPLHGQLGPGHWVTAAVWPQAARQTASNDEIAKSETRSM